MLIPELAKRVVDVLVAKLVPFIYGPPGVGKSDVIRQIAKQHKLKVIDLRLSQCDPVDMLGFPTHDGKRMGYAPPQHFPLEGLDTPPDGYNGWLLFLDEFSSAPLAVQAAAYKLIQDKQVGLHALHSKCAVVAAGNEEQDGGIVNRQSTPMQSRLIHLPITVAAEPWLQWATENDLDHRVISYVESHPDELHKFDPNHDDKTFACPRTWHFASKLIKDKEFEHWFLPLLTGTVSAGSAHGFVAHVEYYEYLPKIGEIISKPLDLDVPDEPAHLHAVGHMIAAYMKETNADPLMAYLQRFPPEFATVALRAALRRNESLLKVPAVRQWAHTIAADIFATAG